MVENRHFFVLGDARDGREQLRIEAAADRCPDWRQQMRRRHPVETGEQVAVERGRKRDAGAEGVKRLRGIILVRLKQRFRHLLEENRYSIATGHDLIQLPRQQTVRAGKAPDELRRLLLFKSREAECRDALLAKQPRRVVGPVSAQDKDALWGHQLGPADQKLLRGRIYPLHVLYDEELRGGVAEELEKLQQNVEQDQPAFRRRRSVFDNPAARFRRDELSDGVRDGSVPPYTSVSHR